MSDKAVVTLDMITGQARLVLAVAELVTEAQHEITVLKQRLSVEQRTRTSNACINCRADVSESLYEFGSPARKVGPLCETCYGIVEAHAAPKRKGKR